MNNNNQFSDEDWSIPIPLTTEILHRAEKFANEQLDPNSEKAKQVYLNTLAVCAVNNYLRIINISTDLSAGDSWNCAIRLIEDVADLWVIGKGSLECLPIKKGVSTCKIPPLIGLERIGYVVVEIDEEQKEAILKGFTGKIAGKAYLSIDDLDSLLNLPSFLNELRPLVNLSQWWKSIFEIGWETVETILGQQQTELILGFRNKSEFNNFQRCKLVELGNQEELVALIVTITPESNSNTNILIELKPNINQNYLPANLEIILSDESEKVIVNTKTEQTNQHIQLDLSGEVGELFSIKLIFKEVTFSEYFVI